MELVKIHHSNLVSGDLILWSSGTLSLLIAIDNLNNIGGSSRIYTTLRHDGSIGKFTEFGLSDRHVRIVK